MAPSYPLRLVAALLLGGFVLAGGPPVRADDEGHGHESEAGDSDDDHDLARDLVERGEIRPLQEIIRALSGELEGTIVSVRLVGAGEGWVYSFTIVTADGNRMKLDVDAAKMTILDEKPKSQ